MEVVEIPREEYLSLLDDRAFLCALEAAGVDGWDGYSHAQDIMNEDQD